MGSAPETFCGATLNRSNGNQSFSETHSIIIRSQFSPDGFVKRDAHTPGELHQIRTFDQSLALIDAR